jgi:uncharacterized protein (TIGR02996 family)
MTPTESGLLRAVLADPADDTVRLVYADWLEENGQPERAEFIRVQLELMKRKGGGRWNRAGPGGWEDCTCGTCSLRRRERELASSAVMWDADRANHAAVPIQWPAPIQFRRGFVESITCTAADWLRHADAIQTCQPVTGVRLTTGIDWFSLDAPTGLWRTGLWLSADGVDVECKNVNYGDWWGTIGLSSNVPLFLLHREFPGIAFTLPGDPP